MQKTRKAATRLGLPPCEAEKSRRLCVGILATLVGDYLQCVVRLLHNLIDCTEVHVFKQESQLFFVARELKPETIVDCSSSIVNNFQFIFGELVVVDFHCYKNYSVKHS